MDREIEQGGCLKGNTGTDRSPQEEINRKKITGGVTETRVYLDGSAGIFFLAGCIDIHTLIRLNPDSSGEIEENFTNIYVS
jgi:hypothetical protein